MTAVPPRRRGFSMPEVLIAIVILAVGILALVVTQAYVARGRAIDEIHLLAAQQAQSTLASISDRACDDFDQTFDEVATPISQDMTRTVTVQNSYSGSVDLRLVTVQVTYLGNHGHSEGRALVSKVIRRAKP